MKLLPMFLMIFLVLSLSVRAEKSTLPEFTVNKEEVENSLKHLLETGQISESDYKKAVLQLGGMNEKQLEDLTKKALGVVKEDPKKAEKMIKEKPAPVPTPSPTPAPEKK